MNIVTLFLNRDQQRELEAALKAVWTDYKVLHYETLDLYQAKCQKNDIIFLGYYSSPELLEKELENIHRINSYVHINIIFFKNHFNALAKAFYYNVNAIFEKKIDHELLKRALIKCEAASSQMVGPSYTALQFLLETPIKIKDDLQMFQYLRQYFKKISTQIIFAMVEADENKVEIIYGSELLAKQEILQTLINFKLPAKPVGQVFANAQNHLYYFPISINEENVIWGLVQTDMKMDDVFTDLFLKYLQNVHLYRKVKEKVQDLTELANTDEITGLFNQRKLAADLESIIQEHEEQNKSFSVMFIDVDHFKKVNDLYGHIVGSQMLIDIGHVLKDQLRDSDLVYRYGGDEFVVIMTDVSSDIVHKIAVRILESVKAMVFDIENGDKYKLSISIGIAEYPIDAKTPKDLIRIADEMMYESKKAGRGKVFHFKEVSKC
jgi:diguanylate cyclase (GGDEF)-like protein